jgi:hypothetical protein
MPVLPSRFPRLGRLRRRQVGTWGTTLTIGARRGRAARGSPRASGNDRT